MTGVQTCALPIFLGKRFCTPGGSSDSIVLHERATRVQWRDPPLLVALINFLDLSSPLSSSRLPLRQHYSVLMPPLQRQQAYDAPPLQHHAAVKHRLPQSPIFDHRRPCATSFPVLSFSISPPTFDHMSSRCGGKLGPSLGDGCWMWEHLFGARWVPDVGSISLAPCACGLR